MLGFIKINFLHDQKVICYYRENVDKLVNYESFLELIKSELMEKLRNHVRDQPIKYNLKLEGTYAHMELFIENRVFKTLAKPIFSYSDIVETVDEDFVNLRKKKTRIWEKEVGSHCRI